MRLVTVLFVSQPFALRLAPGETLDFGMGRTPEFG